MDPQLANDSQKSRTNNNLIRSSPSSVKQMSLRKMSTMPEEEFNADVNSQQPPSPATTDDCTSLLAGNRKIAIANSTASNTRDNGVQVMSSRQFQGSSHSGIYEKDQPGGKTSRLLELNNGNKAKYPSMRSLKSTDDPAHQQLLSVNPPNASWASIVYSDSGNNVAKPFPESVSIRSLASIGMGSSDGRKLTIRKVPTSPSELLNMVHPPT